MNWLRSILLGGCLVGAFSAIGADSSWGEKLGAAKKAIRRSANWEEMATALEPLRTEDHVEAVKYLITLMRRDRTHPAIARQAAEIMAGYHSPAVREFMLAYFAQNPSPSPFVLEAAAGMAVPGLQPAFLKIIGLRTASPGEKALALLALGEYGEAPEETIALIIDRMRHDESPVIRRFAAEALGGIRQRDVIPVLIEGLPDKLIGGQCEDSLRRLTGENHGRDQAAWNRWWQEHGAQCELKNIPRQEFRKIKKQELAAANLEQEDGPAFASFYGIRVDGKNLLFVLDRSGSMNEGSPPRIETLKYELLEMVEKLGPEVNFGIILFGSLTAFPKNGVGPADEENKARARKFIAKIYAKGGTPLAMAMDFTFKKRVAKHNIDTIFLLSDGEPTDSSPEKCRELIFQLNAHHYVTIHTVSIGQESPLMRDVAGDNNGNYRWAR